MPAFQNVTPPEDPHEFLNESFFEHLGEISGILFFLLGAMTIVELVDAHDGFRAITDRISTTDRVKLLWIISWVSFFLSAGLDNMTTTIIIMCALIRRIVRRLFFGNRGVLSAELRRAGLHPALTDYALLRLDVAEKTYLSAVRFRTLTVR